VTKKHAAYILIAAGVGIYLYENDVGKLAFPTIEEKLPGPVALDLVLILAGIGLLVYHHSR